MKAMHLRLALGADVSGVAGNNNRGTATILRVQWDVAAHVTPSASPEWSVRANGNSGHDRKTSGSNRGSSLLRSLEDRAVLATAITVERGKHEVAKRVEDLLVRNIGRARERQLRIDTSQLLAALDEDVAFVVADIGQAVAAVGSAPADVRAELFGQLHQVGAHTEPHFAGLVVSCPSEHQALARTVLDDVETALAKLARRDAHGPLFYDNVVFVDSELVATRLHS